MNLNGSKSAKNLRLAINVDVRTLDFLYVSFDTSKKTNFKRVRVGLGLNSSVVSNLCDIKDYVFYRYGTERA